MSDRRSAAGFVVVLAIGVLLAPVESSGRPGGSAAGGSLSSHGGFRPPVVRPLVRLPPPAATGLGTLRTTAVPRRLAGHHPRRFRGFVLGSPYVYGTSYPSDSIVGYPDGQAPSVYPGADTAPIEGDNPVIVYRPRGCPAQTQTVPSEDGGERSVTIRRC